MTGAGKSLGVEYFLSTNEGLKTCDGVYVLQETLYNTRHWYLRETLDSTGSRLGGSIFYEGGLNFKKKKKKKKKKRNQKMDRLENQLFRHKGRMGLQPETRR